MNRCIIVDSLLRTSADRLSQAFASVHGGTATSVEGMRVIPIKNGHVADVIREKNEKLIVDVQQL